MNEPIDIKPEFTKGVEWVLKKAELELAVKLAQISLDNCSWATGDSNRAKLAEAKAQLAEHEDLKNGR